MTDADWSDIPADLRPAVAALAKKIAAMTNMDVDNGVTLEVEGARLDIPSGAL